MKTRDYVCALFAVLLLTAGSAFAQSPLPSPTGYVNDYAGVINRATRAELETTLTNLDREQKIQFAVAVVDTTGGQEIFAYSIFGAYLEQLERVIDAVDQIQAN